MRSCPRSRELGASLVEILVATVLGLVVLVFSTRSVLALVVSESRSGAARALVETLELARSAAVQRRGPVSVCGLDARDAKAAPGVVRCARSGAAWQAGWIVYGDDNLNGELDDGEAVLQVTRSAQFTVLHDGASADANAITFRPIGTLASATSRRLLLSVDRAAPPTHAVCVAIDGYARALPISSGCQ